MRKFISFLFIIILFFSVGYIIHAQDAGESPKSNGADTSPTDFFYQVLKMFMMQSSGPANGGELNNTNSSTNTGIVATGTLKNVLEFNQQINDRLQRGFDGDYNRMVTTLSSNGYSSTYREGRDGGVSNSGTYWCTNSIIDSFNLAGINGLSINAGHQAVVVMRQFWKNAGGKFLYVQYDGVDKRTALQKVQPGCAIFFESTVDANGNGIHTGREHVAMVKQLSIDENGNGTLITNDSNSSAKGHSYPVAEGVVKNTPYPLRGFGCLAE